MFQESEKHIAAYIAHREMRETQIIECLRSLQEGTFVTDDYIVKTVYKVKHKDVT
jgi:predicted transcriptional regulator